VACLAFSPDGQHLAAAAQSRETIWLWNLAAHQRPHVFSTVWPNMWLRFSTDGSHLETSTGPLRLPPTHLSNESGVGNTSNACLIGVANWITYDSVKLMLLPLEHKWFCVATSGNTLALGLHSGQVIFFAFDNRSRRPWV
jgi:WD40 repeat protein